MSRLSFTAIDFETANSNRGSVCSVGLVKVTNGKVVDSSSWLIRPPEGLDDFDPRNIMVHGITAADVADAVSWRASLKRIEVFAGDDHLVSYNAPFDASVMRSASAQTGVTVPARLFYCALELSKNHLQLPAYKLPHVSAALNLPAFEHHEAASDALACAHVVLALAAAKGFTTLPEVFQYASSAVGDLYPLRGSLARPTSIRSSSYAPNIRVSDLPQADLEADPSHPFYGQVFCFTGDLATYERTEAMAQVAKVGASSGNNVTKRTSFLVIGQRDAQADLDPQFLEGTSKARKAVTYQEAGQDISILSERQFLELLDGRPAALTLDPPTEKATSPIRYSSPPKEYRASATPAEPDASSGITDPYHQQPPQQQRKSNVPAGGSQFSKLIIDLLSHLWKSLTKK